MPREAGAARCRSPRVERELARLHHFRCCVDLIHQQTARSNARAPLHSALARRPTTTPRCKPFRRARLGVGADVLRHPAERPRRAAAAQRRPGCQSARAAQGQAAAACDMWLRSAPRRLRRPRCQRWSPQAQRVRAQRAQCAAPHRSQGTPHIGGTQPARPSHRRAARAPRAPPLPHSSSPLHRFSPRERRHRGALALCPAALPFGSLARPLRSRSSPCASGGRDA